VEIDVAVWDNASTDDTRTIVRDRYPSVRLVDHPGNVGFWCGIEHLATDDDADAFVALTDVVLDPDFARMALDALKDPTVGAVQGRILQPSTSPTVIDTVGFAISRARHITIAGHGEPDDGRYRSPQDVFAVEGAAPVFRTVAFRDSAVNGSVVDPAFRAGPIGYGDDIDLAWRMRLFGWRQVLAPDAVGWHARATTRDRSAPGSSLRARARRRRAIPRETRILDWVNTRCSMIKNDRWEDLRQALLPIAAREIAVLGFMLLAEPEILVGVPRLARRLPATLRARRIVQARARAPMSTWFV